MNAPNDLLSLPGIVDLGIVTLAANLDGIKHNCYDRHQYNCNLILALSIVVLLYAQSLLMCWALEEGLYRRLQTTRK